MELKDDADRGRLAVAQNPPLIGRAIHALSDSEMKRVSQTTGNAMAHSPALAATFLAWRMPDCIALPAWSPIDFRSFYGSLTARLIRFRVRCELSLNVWSY
jgi:hypothetical protein